MQISENNYEQLSREVAIADDKAKPGAEALMMTRFKQYPDKPGTHKVPAVLDDKIMQAIGGSENMMAYGMRSGELDLQGMSLSLVPSDAEADRLFASLAADGTVQMPIGKTFFSPRGPVAYKFGVSGMIIAQS